MKRHSFLLKLISLAIAFLTWMGCVRPAIAGPALQWWYLYPDLSQSECVNRAVGVMAVEKFPIKNRDSNGVLGANEQATASIACIKRGSDLQAVVIVTSPDRDYAHNLMTVFRDGIKTGVLE